MAYAYEREDEHEGQVRPGLGGKLRDIFGSLGRRDDVDEEEEYDEPGQPTVTYSKGASGARPNFRVATVGGPGRQAQLIFQIKNPARDAFGILANQRAFASGDFYFVQIVPGWVAIV